MNKVRCLINGKYAYKNMCMYAGMYVCMCLYIQPYL